MDKLWNLIEAHLGKAIGIPLGLNTIQFLLMLVNAISDGVLSHEELEALMKAGNGITLVLLALVMAYMKFKKP